MNKANSIRGMLRKGEYYDSVSLMKLAQKLREFPGVIDSAAVMGSPENLAILESADLFSSNFQAASGNDLVIALMADNEQNADRALGEIENILSSLRAPRRYRGRAPRTIEDAIKFNPDSNLALISVAGKFAGQEAMKALQAGLHAMIFSDNVPLEIEIELKRYAQGRGLLVMGPDCGTAIINGAPLGFANAVNRGAIGIVAASGTGLQEVSCIISNEGAGISQAIGVGSRDIKSALGGIMFIEAIKAITKRQGSYKETRVLLLVSKPPDPDVLEKILLTVGKIPWQVVAVFLGGEKIEATKSKLYFARSLEEGALMAMSYSRGYNPYSIAKALDARDADYTKVAKVEAPKLSSGQRYLRGLFSGGTFCYEAQVLLKNTLRGVYSNAPFGNNCKLQSPLKSEQHTLIDMGADEFTVGRLHPMIDFSLRAKRIVQEASDPGVAVILLDIVLGYGANKNPLGDISPAIKEAKSIAAEARRHLPIVASVTGTDNDPQNRSSVITGLTELEVIIAESNAAASKLAGLIASCAESKV